MNKPLNQKPRVSPENFCREKALKALDGVVFHGKKEYFKAMVKVTNAMLEIIVEGRKV